MNALDKARGAKTHGPPRSSQLTASWCAIRDIAERCAWTRLSSVWMPPFTRLRKTRPGFFKRRPMPAWRWWFPAHRNRALAIPPHGERSPPRRCHLTFRRSSCPIGNDWGTSAKEVGRQANGRPVDVRPCSQGWGTGQCIRRIFRQSGLQPPRNGDKTPWLSRHVLMSRVRHGSAKPQTTAAASGGPPHYSTNAASAERTRHLAPSSQLWTLHAESFVTCRPAPARAVWCAVRRSTGNSHLTALGRLTSKDTVVCNPGQFVARVRSTL